MAGRKIVTKDRKPQCSAINVSWFNAAFLRIAQKRWKIREGFRRIAGKTIYCRGRYVVAMNVRTGKKFKTLKHLLAYRNRHKIGKGGYGPAIHLFLDKPPGPILGNRKRIMVAFNPKEIVHDPGVGYVIYAKSRKIGVFRIKVLT